MAKRIIFDMQAVTARDRAILNFEAKWWKQPGAKEAAIRETFDLTSTRYYQLLNALLDRPEAMAEFPFLVKRLRRIRMQRTRQRTSK